MEKEVFFSLGHKVDEATMEIVFEGDEDLFSFIFSSKEYVNELENEGFKKAKRTILNTALNICEQDSKIREVFLNGLLNIKKK